MQVVAPNVLCVDLIEGGPRAEELSGYFEAFGQVVQVRPLELLPELRYRVKVFIGVVTERSSLDPSRNDSSELTEE